MTRLERLLLDLSIGLSASTGSIYYVMKQWMRPRDPFSVLGHPWQPYALAAHVLVGPVVIFALGLIAREHIFERIVSGRPQTGRRTGLFITSLALPMVLSGYLLQVVTRESLHGPLVVLHLGSGALFAAVYLGHLLLAPKRPKFGNGGGFGRAR